MKESFGFLKLEMLFLNRDEMSPLAMNVTE